MSPRIARPHDDSTAINAASRPRSQAISAPAHGHFTLTEEVFNTVTHGVGLVLSIIGLVALVVIATGAGDPWQIVGVSVFGASLVLLYGASTLYHGVPSRKAKRVLRHIDHTAIYLLIAGTYTPFMLVTMRGPWGWAIFGVVWGLALLGIGFQYTHLHRWEIARVVLFVVMGWTLVIGVVPFVQRTHPGGIALIAAGGAAYTGGIVFYAWHRLPHNHAIWHVCVLAGSVCHFLAVLWYLEPVGA